MSACIDILASFVFEDLELDLLGFPNCRVKTGFTAHHETIPLRWVKASQVSKPITVTITPNPYSNLNLACEIIGIFTLC